MNEKYQYYILDGMQLKQATLAEYAEQLELGEHIVEHTCIESGAEVWTCLMGHDQRDPPSEHLPPLLFETMIVGVQNYHDVDIELTSTVGQAKSTHYKHVEQIRRLLKQRRLRGY